MKMAPSCGRGHGFRMDAPLPTREGSVPTRDLRANKFWSAVGRSTTRGDRPLLVPPTFCVRGSVGVKAWALRRNHFSSDSTNVRPILMICSKNI